LSGFLSSGFADLGGSLVIRYSTYHGLLPRNFERPPLVR
jgi:hypothetical protein